MCENKRTIQILNEVAGQQIIQWLQLQNTVLIHRVLWSMYIHWYSMLKG